MANDNFTFSDSFTLDPVLFYDAVVRSTDDYIYVVDMKTDMALVSDNMVRDFDLPGRLIPGLVPMWGDFIHARDRVRYDESIEQMLKGITDEHNVEYQIRNRNHEYVWVICRGVLKRDSSGDPIMFAGIVTNLSNRGRVDSVTGLFMHMECERLVEKYLEESRPGGILLLGLDDFAGINNLKGHAYGDSVLRLFAQEVQRLLPENAGIYRYDGDQFVVVYKNASADDMLSLYSKVDGYCDCRHQVDDLIYYCTVSGGIAILGQDGDSYLDLLNNAAAALDASKQKGKHTCTFYKEDMSHLKLRSFKIMENLRSSVMNQMEGFYLAYQPIVRTSDVHMVEAEALLRWSCDDLGSISPGEFIPLLESSGLIIQVGKWVLEQAVIQCKDWLKFCPSFVMNVNCSYIQMLDESFVRFLQETITKHDLDPVHIVLELTESRFITDEIKLKDTFESLRGLNVQLAMDDFGTGYSSLGLLSTTPADIVKIDRTFISKISDSDHMFNRSFIGAVIQLCHSVGISVCVEGVEQKEELDTVCQLEADCVQGFYVSKPVTADKFEEVFFEM